MFPFFLLSIRSILVAVKVAMLLLYNYTFKRSSIFHYFSTTFHSLSIHSGWRKGTDVCTIETNQTNKPSMADRFVDIYIHRHTHTKLTYNSIYGWSFTITVFLRLYFHTFADKFPVESIDFLPVHYFNKYFPSTISSTLHRLARKYESHVTHSHLTILI